MLSPESIASKVALAADRLELPKHRWLGVGWKLVAVASVALIAAVAVWWFAQRPVTVRYTTSVVTRGAVTRTITATGTVNPVLTIIVGSYVSGVISDVYCDYNTRVRKGQLCAKVDDRPYKAALEQAQGQ